MRCSKVHTKLLFASSGVLKHFIILCIFISFSPYCKATEKTLEVLYSRTSPSDTLLKAAHILYLNKEYNAAIIAYQQLLRQKHPDSIILLRNMALSSAAIQDISRAVWYTEKYIQYTADVTFPKHIAFEAFRNTDAFKTIEKKYVPRLSAWSVFYLYIAVISSFVAILLNLRKNTNRVANVLISLFVFLHSLSIIHLFFHVTNYKYYSPHILFSTASFSFLYGPLLYGYFKSIQNYTLRWIDLFHVLPFLIYTIYVFPKYNLSGIEKLSIILREESIYPYLTGTLSATIVSMIVYGGGIWEIYNKNTKHNDIKSTPLKWQKRIWRSYVFYILSYGVYTLLSTSVLMVDWLYQTQIVLMSLLVLYMGYSAYKRSVFGDMVMAKNDMLFKYKKSGLTTTYSGELKENLIRLLEEEKIYRDNNVNLEILSGKLGTTRHNTSQIINEHFNMNFFELINTYRIDEVIDLLKNKKRERLNIIDIAYEVGFNNKVTFNKAFKKITLLTPTQFIEKLAKNEIVS